MNCCTAGAHAVRPYQGEIESMERANAGIAYFDTRHHKSAFYAPVLGRAHGVRPDGGVRSGGGVRPGDGALQ